MFCQNIYFSVLPHKTEQFIGLWRQGTQLLYDTYSESCGAVLYELRSGLFVAQPEWRSAPDRNLMLITRQNHPAIAEILNETEDCLRHFPCGQHRILTRDYFPLPAARVKTMCADMLERRGMIARTESSLACAGL